MLGNQKNIIFFMIFGLTLPLQVLSLLKIQLCEKL